LSAVQYSVALRVEYSVEKNSCPVVTSVKRIATVKCLSHYGHGRCAAYPGIVTEMPGNFTMSGEWSPC